MTTQSATNGTPSSPLDVLRCPCCMSPLARSEDALTCTVCARTYAFQHRGGRLVIPSLRRDDGLATLDQDIVVSRSDPDSARLDYRRHIAEAERRESFLAPLMGYSSTGATEPEADLVERFARELGPNATALFVGDHTPEWAARQGAASWRVWRIAYDPVGSIEAREDGAREVIVGANIMELPFAPAVFDGIWCGDAFGLVRPDRRAVFFRQVNRALRPGGLLYLDAVVATRGDTWGRYLRWRYLYHQPVVREECIDRSPLERSGGWRYHTVARPRDLHALCRQHGFKVLLLRLAGPRALVLARKERGTDA